MSLSQEASQYFRDGFNCAQSVVRAFLPRLGLDADMAMKLSSGFGAGMGRRQEICGAVTGAVIVLNILYGRGLNDGRDRQEAIYKRVKRFLDRIEARRGSVNCSVLLENCDLTTPEGQERFRNDKMIERCYSYVESAVEILEEELSKP